MNNLFLKIDDEKLSIMNSAEEWYFISTEDLPQTRQDNTSEWILQLIDKEWIQTRILYELAKSIKLKFPTVFVDWKKTFYVVEKNNYLQSLGEIMIKKSGSFAEELDDMIEFGLNQSNEETEAIIQRIVEKRLSEFGLN